MAETENAPSWLNELDRKEAEWAASYLSKRWPEGLKAKPSPTPPMLYHSLAESIHELEKYAAGVKLIERMRNSIRQRRYRLAEGGRKRALSRFQQQPNPSSRPWRKDTKLLKQA